jgi:membrane-associated protein
MLGLVTGPALSGFLDPKGLIHSAGPWGLLLVCAIIFVETGLLVGFIFPGDTLLFFTGVLTLTGTITLPVWLVILCVVIAAIAGDQLGYWIGRSSGPRVFERREHGLISQDSVTKTHEFFRRFGAASVPLSRFVPVVRTFAPVAAGIAKMPYPRFVLFDVIGGIAWPSVLILLGYFVGKIPGVAHFVSTYIDVVLLGIVVVSVIPIIIRLAVARRGARRAGNATE